jgi:hypothetical protein
MVALGDLKEYIGIKQCLKHKTLISPNVGDKMIFNLGLKFIFMAIVTYIISIHQTF